METEHCSMCQEQNVPLTPIGQHDSIVEQLYDFVQQPEDAAQNCRFCQNCLMIITLTLRVSEKVRTIQAQEEQDDPPTTSVPDGCDEKPENGSELPATEDVADNHIDEKERVSDDDDGSESKLVNFPAAL